MPAVQNVRAKLKFGWLAKKVIMVSCQLISKPSFYSLRKEHERKLTWFIVVVELQITQLFSV